MLTATIPVYSTFSAVPYSGSLSDTGLVDHGRQLSQVIGELPQELSALRASRMQRAASERRWVATLYQRFKRFEVYG